MMDHIENQLELAIDLEVYILLNMFKIFYFIIFSIILIDHIKVLHV